MNVFFQVIREILQEERREYQIDIVPSIESEELVLKLLEATNFTPELYKVRSITKLSVSSFYKYKLDKSITIYELVNIIKNGNFEIKSDEHRIIPIRSRQIRTIPLSYFLHVFQLELYYDKFSRIMLYDPSFFRVYNIGQGLLNVFGNTENLNLFDFGSFSFDSSFIYPLLVDFDFYKIRNVFISHFHSDHYNLIDPSVMPNLENIIFPVNSKLFGIQIIKILLKAYHTGVKLIPVQDGINMGQKLHTFSSSKYEINLHFGKPKPSNPNSNGLLLYIEAVDEIDKIFTGDAYIEVLNKVKLYYPNNLVEVCCPHHGGHVGRSKLANFNGEKCVMSYYPGFYKSIPNKYTKTEFVRSGYKIMHTICINEGDYYSV